jgi:hypothetical protein
MTDAYQKLIYKTVKLATGHMLKSRENALLTLERGYINRMAEAHLHFANEIARLANPELPRLANDRRVLCCAYCFRASCWQSVDKCQDHKTATVVALPVSVLSVLACEDPKFLEKKKG